MKLTASVHARIAYRARHSPSRSLQPNTRRASELYHEILDEDRDLKDTAMKIVVKHAKELMNRGEFVALCKEMAEISFDAFKALLEAPQPLLPNAKVCNLCYGAILSRNTSATVAVLFLPISGVLFRRGAGENTVEGLGGTVVVCSPLLSFVAAGKQPGN